jgi:porin
VVHGAVSRALLFAIALLVAVAAAPARGQQTSRDYGNSSGIGGPSSTPGQLEGDVAHKRGAVKSAGVDAALSDWFEIKSRIRQKIGLAIGTEYTTLVQGGGPAAGDENLAASGRWALLGSWALVDFSGPHQGDLVFKGENRHRLGTDLAPASLNESLGTVLTTAVAFSDSDWILTNLYWHQELGDGRFALAAGQLDPTDYVDTYPFVSPWTTFLNGAFGNSPAIAMPNQTLGFAAGALPGDHLYGVAGFADPNGNPAHPFDSFFGGGDFFVHGEVGWVSSMERRHEDNVHVTGWYVTERAEAGVGPGWGLAFSASWRFRDRWTPFVRGGFSVGDTAAAKGIAAVGLGLALRGDDLLGIGLAWTRSAQGGGRDQYIGELFYRLHVLRNLALTPDVQVILNPVGRPLGSAVAIGGLRLRLNF